MRIVAGIVFLASLTAFAFSDYGGVSRFLDSKERNDLLYATAYSRNIEELERQALTDSATVLGMLSDKFTVIFLGPGRHWRLTFLDSNGYPLGKPWRDAVMEQQELYLDELKFDWCLSNIHETCGNVPHHY